jgi:hypothetical protein
VTLAPIEVLAGLLEPISCAGVDTYARLRVEGKGGDDALQSCIDQRRVNTSQDRDPELLEPLVTAFQLAEFEALTQLAFAHDLRELLALVQWPDKVNAFLLSCDQLC